MTGTATARRSATDERGHIFIEFLFIVLNVDGWVKLAYPFPHGHGGYFSGAPPADHWRAALERAGFEVTEVGTRPATLYLLGRIPQGQRTR